MIERACDYGDMENMTRDSMKTWISQHREGSGMTVRNNALLSWSRFPDVTRTTLHPQSLSLVDSTWYLVLIRIEVDRIDKVYLSFFPPQSPVSVLQFGAAVSSALGCTDWVGWWIRNLSIQQTSRIQPEFTQKWKSFISCSTFYWGREGQM